MSLRPSGRVDAIAALSLVAAFVLAGWKIFNRLPAVSYALAPQQAALPDLALKALPDASLPQQQRSPDGRFCFENRGPHGGGWGGACLTGCRPDGFLRMAGADRVRRLITGVII